MHIVDKNNFSLSQLYCHNCAMCKQCSINNTLSYCNMRLLWRSVPVWDGASFAVAYIHMLKVMWCARGSLGHTVLITVWAYGVSIASICEPGWVNKVMIAQPVDRLFSTLLSGVEVSGKHHIPHCLGPASWNKYLVHRSKVGSIAAGWHIGPHCQGSVNGLFIIP